MTIILFCGVLLLVTFSINKCMEDGVDFGNLLSIQIIVISILLLMIAVLSIFIMRMVSEPLMKMNSELRDHRKLTLQGASELQELCRTYNRMFTRITTESDKLNYEASHDALTGLYNRKIFEEVRSDDNMEAYTMILMDIDDFKNFNDNYGHDTGDKVLQKMGRIMQENFRSDDYPCRIGGDEFAVIMVRSDERLKDLIINKIDSIRKQMADTSDGLPKATVSAGVAFSDGEEDIYKKADEALYTSKNEGCDRYTFYVEKEKTQ